MTVPLSSSQIENIEDHLRSRGLDPSKTQVILDKENNMATFLLYNLSGQLVGYHGYNPRGDRKVHNDSLAGKYFTYVTKEDPHTSKIAVWGTETLKKDNPNLFVTEGVFDAVKLHNMGLPAIAVLSNNPKILKSWFAILNKKTIAITDNDEAGRKLGNLCDESFTTPAPYKDLGEMPQKEVEKFINTNVLKSKTTPHLEVRPIEHKDEWLQIRDWMLHHHYINRMPSAIQAKLGVYINGKMEGVLLYGATVRPTAGSEIFKNQDGSPVMQNNQAWELLRAFTTETAKKEIPNLGSMIIAKGNNWIQHNAKTTDGKPVKAILTYADSDVGHTGRVYQATNALFLGKQKPKDIFIVINKNGTQHEFRTMSTKELKKIQSLGYKVVRRKGAGKFKYVYPLGTTPMEKEELTSKIAVPIFSYPKEGEPSKEIPNVAKEKLSKQQSRPQQEQPVSKRETIKRLLTSKVNNPETGNKILVKTALGYDKNHPSYKQARGMVTSYAKKYGIRLKSSRF